MDEMKAYAAIPAAAEELAKKIHTTVKRWRTHPQLSGWIVSIEFGTPKTELSIYGYDYSLEIEDKLMKLPDGDFDYSDGIYTHALSVIRHVTKCI